MGIIIHIPVSAQMNNGIIIMIIPLFIWALTGI